MNPNYCKKYHDGGLRKDVVKCTLCGIICDTMEQFDIHTSGKSHTKKMKMVNSNNLSEISDVKCNTKEHLESPNGDTLNETKIALNKPIENVSVNENELGNLMRLITPKVAGNNYECLLCNMKMNCKEQYDVHCNGSKHQKKLTSFDIPTKYNTEGYEKAFQEDCVVLKSAGVYEHKLLVASKEGNLQMAELSLKMKCDIEICDEENRRPIHYACINGYVEIVQLLIKNNCDFRALDKNKQSPLDLAKQKAHQNIIEILNSAKRDLILKKQIASMGLICGKGCCHEFCSISFAAKSFSKGQIIQRNNGIEVYRRKASLIAREFAIKCIPVDNIDENNGRNIEENVNYYLEVLQHVRIVRYFGAIEIDRHVCIFMEFLSRGSLGDEIQRKRVISTENVIRYSCQISEGLSYLHKIKIIHRDIKPGNILLDEDDNIKLVDFGISRSLTRTDGHTTHTQSSCGTPNFMAPEVIHGENYTFSADIWSLGATIINMISGSPPYHGLIREAVIFKIGSSKTLELPTENISDPMKTLIKQMINPIPEFRPHASDLVNEKLYK